MLLPLPVAAASARAASLPLHRPCILMPLAKTNTHEIEPQPLNHPRTPLGPLSPPPLPAAPPACSAHHSLQEISIEELEQMLQVGQSLQGGQGWAHRAGWPGVGAQGRAGCAGGPKVAACSACPPPPRCWSRELAGSFLRKGRWFRARPVGLGCLGLLRTHPPWLLASSPPCLRLGPSSHAPFAFAVSSTPPALLSTPSLPPPPCSPDHPCDHPPTLLLSGG